MRTLAMRYVAILQSILFAGTVPASAAAPVALKSATWEWMETVGAAAIACAEDIWNNPELGEYEFISSARLAGYLEANGFSLEHGVADLPTAWVATFSNGAGPAIGFLAEFDALPGLSQQAANPTRQPVVADGPGHGCGHNLLGTAAAYGAIGLRQAMLRDNIRGTIRVYGCPAEETLVGKVYMARDGVFDASDVIIGWHPGNSNFVDFETSLAVTSIKFRFHGRSAHAGSQPHRGRSALDAVELMNTGVQYMREHIISDARIHHVITSGGGAPNVVPDLAEVWYFVRTPTYDQQAPILAWLREIAAGAALMTQTRTEEYLLTSARDLLLNEPLAEMLQRNLEQVGPPQFDATELAFARDISKTLETPFDEPLATTVQPLNIVPPDQWRRRSSSTDDGDVSWVRPCARFRTATGVRGVPGHSWQTVSVSGSSIGLKGMLAAGKVFAGAGIDLLTEAGLIERARQDFTEKLAGRTYTSGVPAGLPPPSRR
jgi:aminobenzoyl-glutamate utilization protein B